MDQCNIHEVFRKITSDSDQEAFRLFYNHFFAKLLRFSFSYTRSREVSEEIVNDVFIHCWQKRHQLTEVKNPQVYLYVAAKNRAIDHIRRQAINKQVPFTGEEIPELVFYNDPEQLMISAEMVRKMEYTVQQLPPRCRTVFILIKQHGLKYKEVAAILHLSVKTVENQLAIALKKLTHAVRFTFEKEMIR